MTWWYRRMIYAMPPRLRIPGGVAASCGVAFVVYKGAKAATAAPRPKTFDADYKAAMEEVRRQQMGDPLRKHKFKE